MYLQDVHYDAFISYRHKEVDQFAAVNLHKKLEAFRLPKNVQDKVTNGRTKIERVFRDDEELPLANNLSYQIGAALSNSDFLIVICTPRLKESHWCLREIETFLQTHDRTHLLVVLAEGGPDESFPDCLTREEIVTTDENGNEIRTVREFEPLAADVRGATKKEVLKNMDIAVLKLAAAMFGLNFDDLKQRHREQRIRRMMQLTAIVSAVILLFAVWSFVTLMKISAQNREIEAQNQTIISQYNELNDKFAGSMAEASGQLLGIGRRKDAVYAVRSVLPDTDENGFHAGAYRALNNALDPYGINGLYVPEELCNFSASVVDFRVSADEKRIAANTGDGMLQVQEPGSSEMLFSVEQCCESGYGNTYAFCGSDFLVFDQEGKTLISSLKGTSGSDPGSAPGSNQGSGETKTLFNEEAQLISDGQGKITFAWLEDAQLLYGLAADGSAAWHIEVPKEINDNEAAFLQLEPSPDGKCFTAVFWDNGGSSVLAADTESGKVYLSFRMPNQYDASAVTDGRNVYAAAWYEQGSDSLAVITARDLNTGEKQWQNSVLCEQSDLHFTGNRLCLENDYQLVSLNSADGESIYTYSDGRQILGAAELDGRLWFAEENGTTCTGDEGYMTERRLLNITPTERLSVFEVHGDNLYILYSNASHVTRYVKQENCGTAAEGAKYEESLHNGGYVEDDRLSALGISAGQVSQCFLSDDENVILVQSTDGTLAFYNAEDNTLLNTVYDESVVSRSLTFSDDIGCWVLNGYNCALIMNEQFEVLAETPACAGAEDGCLVLTPDGESFLKVPFVPYTEMISRADSLLAGHQPQEAIKRRYNLI